MGRIRNTWELAKASWNVLSHDKELIVLPVISGIVTIAVAVSFFLPLFASGNLEEPGTGTYIMFAVFYFVAAYITIFFNAALVHAAHDRLTGGDPTIGSALRSALGDAGHILPWALISATVSWILRSLEERAGFVGQLALSLVGLAWSLVTFLVLPVLVVERVGAFEAIKRSANLFKGTWGENVAANVGFGIIGFVAVLPGIALIALAVGGGATGAVLFGAIILAVTWILLVSVTMAALSAIFQTALYHYAVDGQAPGQFFPQESLDTAFLTKQNKRFLR
jgi:hypothetical protein